MTPPFYDQSQKANSLEVNLDKHYHQVYSGEAEDYDSSRFSKPRDQKFHADELAKVIELLMLRGLAQKMPESDVFCFKIGRFPTVSSMTA